MQSVKTVIFCGTPSFAIPSLEALIASNAFDVQLVITQSDKPVGRKHVLTASPVKIVAQQAGIPVLQPSNINTHDVWLPQTDFLITAAYGQILKQHILDHPHIAAVNIHGSLLPAWRGASPIQHAILNGDKTTGVTVQNMVAKLDAGSILAQAELTLNGTETYEDLHDTLAKMSAPLLIETLSKPLRATEQDEGKATTCKKLSRLDGEVDPETMTAQEIDRRVRALVPWPGVTCSVQKQHVKLWSVSLQKQQDSIALRCKEDSVLYIRKLQSPGKTILDAKTWIRGQNRNMRTILSLLLAGALLFPLPHVFASLDDMDGDGLSNAEEDKNGNGIVDNGETNPANADSDDGGEADGSEVANGRNPLNQKDDMTFDADGDGLTNGEEILLGTDPNLADTDGDGLNDRLDVFPLDSNFKYDTDNDGLPDAYEEQYGLLKEDPTDAEQDLDGDGLSNLEEFIFGTDPTNPDSDEDGTVDGEEIELGEEPLESACLEYSGANQPFVDTEGHWAKTYIHRLHSTKILPDSKRLVEGYLYEGDRYFAPDQYISRFELLKMTLLSACIQLAEDKERLSISFSDIPSTPRPHESPDEKLRRRVVYTAVRKDVVQGYYDNTFRPDAPINRAEAIKILLEATKMQPIEGESGKKFPDVQSTDWFASYVTLATMHEIMSGYPDGYFRPEQPITRGEAAKIIYRLMLINPMVNGYELPSEGI